MAWCHTLTIGIIPPNVTPPRPPTSHAIYFGILLQAKRNILYKRELLAVVRPEPVQHHLAGTKTPSQWLTDHHQLSILEKSRDLNPSTPDGTVLLQYYLVQHPDHPIRTTQHSLPIPPSSSGQDNDNSQITILLPERLLI